MENIQYVGMDVHKDTIAISMFINYSRDPEIEKVILNTKKAIYKFFEDKKKKGKVITCYEAGCLGYEIHRLLKEIKVNCLVVAPGRIPKKPGDRIKTDRRDARMLARLLKSGELTSIYIPTEEDEATRDLIRMRDDFRKALMRSRHQLQKFLLRHRIDYTEGNQSWTIKHHAWIKKLKFENEMLQETLEYYHYGVRDLEERIRRVDVKILEVAKSDRYTAQVEKLRCLKGIEYLSAISLVCEIGDFKRFPTAMTFMSFLGLVPRERSSGNTRRLGGITKAGNDYLRRILVEGAWTYSRKSLPSVYMAKKRANHDEETISYAVRASNRLEKKYIRLRDKGKVASKVNIAIARELSGFIWGLMVGQIN